MFNSFKTRAVVAAASSGVYIRTPGPLSIDAFLKYGAAAGMAYRHDAVSYTHLDVYKRQCVYTLMPSLSNSSSHCSLGVAKDLKAIRKKRKENAKVRVSFISYQLVRKMVNRFRVRCYPPV